MLRLFSAPALPAGFLAEERALLGSRLRVGGILAIVSILAFIPIDAIRMPDRFGVATAIRLAGCTVLAVLLQLIRRSAFQRRLLPVTALLIAVIAAIILGIGRLADGPNDPIFLVQVMGVIFLVVGAGALLPVDGRTLLLLGLVPFVMQIGVSFDFDFQANLPVLTSTLMALGIGMIGAETSFASRLAAYEGRRAREELLRARADWVAMLTHDIKNPLGVIGGYVEILRDGRESSRADLEILNRIEAAARRALMLATNFLDVSRIQAAGIELRREPTDVRMLLRHAILHQRCIAEVRHVALEEDAEGPLPPIEADAPLLDRVFANLVNNAVKFAPEGGVVRLLARRDGDRHVEVIVEDDGPGIPPEILPLLFSRYGKTASTGESTGLGLFIAKTIVEAHGGTITAENRIDGPGARFRVLLPASAEVDGAREADTALEETTAMTDAGL